MRTTPTSLNFTINGVEISLHVLYEDVKWGMYVLGDPGTDDVVRVARQGYWAWDTLVFCLCHEAWHLEQKKQGRLMAIKDEPSMTAFSSSYSAFSKAEEEAEAYALLCTKGEGMTGPYFFQEEDQVQWLRSWWRKFGQMGYYTPEPTWAEREFERRSRSKGPPGPPPVPPAL